MHFFPNFYLPLTIIFLTLTQLRRNACHLSSPALGALFSACPQGGAVTERLTVRTEQTSRAVVCHHQSCATFI